MKKIGIASFLMSFLLLTSGVMASAYHQYICVVDSTQIGTFDVEGGTCFYPTTSNGTVSILGVGSNETIYAYPDDTCDGNHIYCAYFGTLSDGPTTYTYIAEVSGYNDYTYDFNSPVFGGNTTKYATAYMTPDELGTLELHVTDSSDQYIDDCMACLFLVNGTWYPTYPDPILSPTDCEPLGSTGHTTIGSLPRDETFYYTITCDDYDLEISPSFILNTNKNYTTVLASVSDWSANLVVSDSTPEQNTSVKYNVYVIGDTNIPWRVDHYKTDTSESATSINETTLYNGYTEDFNPFYYYEEPSKWINWYSCGEQQVRAKVYNQLGEYRYTDYLTITVDCAPGEGDSGDVPSATTTTTTPGATTTTTLNPDIFDPISPINQTEWEEAGYGQVAGVFSPFFLASLFMIVLSAVAGRMGGPIASFGSVVILLIVYTVYGIYPAWIAIVLGLMAGAVVAKLVGVIG